jgi:hypothetical protein
MNCRFIVALVVAVSLVFLGCGGGDGSGGNDPSDCRITVSGALSSVHDCAMPATVSWYPGPGGDTAVLAFGYSGNLGSDVSTTVLIDLPAPPELKTYQGTDPGVSPLVVVVPDMQHLYEAAPESLTFTITSVGDPIDASSASHLVHGTLHATLKAEGSTGEVVLDVTF